MYSPRLAAILLTAAAAAAQQQPPAPPPFHTQSRLVQAWVTLEGSAAARHDLTADDFRLRIDGRAHPVQNVDSLETGVAPVALVAVVETAGLSAAALGKIRRVGAMIQALLTGERGRAAVIAFDDQVRTVLPFTADGAEIAAAFSGLTPARAGTKSARLIDAVLEGLRLPGSGVAAERRVLMLISESKDRGSSASLESAIDAVRAAGVQVFALTWSAWLTPFTTKAGELPASGPMDPLGGLAELGRLGKTNTTAALTSATGGRLFSFARLSGLEKALGALGEELRDQYVLSFTPPDGIAPGWHEIAINIEGISKNHVRSRPGFLYR